LQLATSPPFFSEEYDDMIEYDDKIGWQ